MFSDERGPGAFTGLTNLPRRRSQSSQAAIPNAVEKKTLFHFENEDSESSDEQQHAPPPPYGVRRHSPPPQQPMNALGLTVDTKNLPPNAPPRIEEPSEGDEKLLQTSSLPFPSRGSPLPSPSPPSPTKSTSTASSSASSLPRTPSTPIILSNGKPLKPSLKSSQSSPHMVGGVHFHARARSEPSTPAGLSPVVKNVHFPEKERIQSVRVFNASGRPVNVNSAGGTSSAGEETETENEYDSSSGVPSFLRGPDAPGAYPFPSMKSLPSSHLSYPPSSPTPTTYTISTATSSPIPRLHPPTYTNVHLETLVLPSSRPLVLRGSVVVQNVCFAKDVAVRFTLDGWITTSEVGGRYVCGLPGLPEPFPSGGATAGDLAARPMGSAHGRTQSESAASAKTPPQTWDRFSFSIQLEDFERKLAEKTLEVVVRYTAHGVGEWWDNNGGENYKVRFDKVEGASSSSAASASSSVEKPENKESKGGANPSSSPVMGNSQQRTFSAPPTLKGTPTTAEAIQHAVGRNSLSQNSSPSPNSSAESLPKLVVPTPESGFGIASRRHHHSHNHHFAGPGHAHTHVHGHPATRPSPPPRTHSSPQPISQSSSYSSYLNGNKGGQRPHSMHASLPTKLNLLNYAAPIMGHSLSAGPSLGVSSVSSSIGGAKVSPPRSPLAQSPISSSNMELGAEMGLVGGMPATAPKVDFNWITKNNNANVNLDTTPTETTRALPPSPPPSYSAFPPQLHASPTSTSSSPSSSDSEQQKQHHPRLHAPRISSPVPVGVDASYAALLKQWCFAQSPSPGASPVGTPVGTPSAGAVVGAHGHGHGHGHALEGNWRMMGFEGLTGLRSESPMMLAGL